MLLGPYGKAVAQIRRPYLRQDLGDKSSANFWSRSNGAAAGFDGSAQAAEQIVHWQGVVGHRHPHAWAPYAPYGEDLIQHGKGSLRIVLLTLSNMQGPLNQCILLNTCLLTQPGKVGVPL